MKIYNIPKGRSNSTSWPWNQKRNQTKAKKSDAFAYPKISIVTPSYNQAQYLEETIRSVILQDYPNLEYIIIDGGSTDGTIDIIKKYQKWITYFVSEPDSGQSHAVNKGFAKCTGELIGWINSDDLYEVDVFHQVASIWKLNNCPGLIYGQTIVIDTDGNNTGEIYGREFEFKDALFFSRNTISQPSTFISRKALESVGFLDENLHMSMDWDLWLRIANMYPILFVPKIWSKFRIWNDSKTSTIFQKSGDEHIAIVRQFIEKNQNYRWEEKKFIIANGYLRKAKLCKNYGDIVNFRINFLIAMINFPFLVNWREFRSLFLYFIFGSKNYFKDKYIKTTKFKNITN